MLSAPTKRFILRAIQEDIGKGDITTRSLIPLHLSGEAWIEAREKGVLCGGPIIREAFKLIDPKLKVIQLVSEGKPFKKNSRIFHLVGSITSILEGERTALNFLGWLSGISTITNAYVRCVKNTKAKIYDTRKTTPGWREIEKYAVKCGGGQNHRFGLWDEIMIKDNHWVVIEKITDQKHPHYFEKKLKQISKQVPVEIEVDHLSQLKHLMGSHFIPHRILLDNFSIRQLKKAVRMIRSNRMKVSLEASGGITLRNLKQIARTGVDRISIGALTHSAPSIDFSLTITKYT